MWHCECGDTITMLLVYDSASLSSLGFVPGNSYFLFLLQDCIYEPMWHCECGDTITMLLVYDSASLSSLGFVPGNSRDGKSREIT
jgi:hypothetical protein